jgi:hypothetical protein
VIDVELPEGGEPVEAGMGGDARAEALRIACEDPEMAAAMDGMEPCNVTPNEDGGFTVECGGVSAVVSAEQIEEALGLEPAEPVEE